MMRIYEEAFGSHVEYVLRNEDTGEFASIVSRGANVRRLALSPGDGLEPISILRGYGTPEELEEGRWSRGIKMIPFPNRIRDGIYSFGGRQFSLPINFPSQHHAIHGLLSDQEMQLVRKTEDDQSCSVTLSFDFTGRFPGYPFGLKVEVTAALDNDGFTVLTRALNIGDDPLPFGDGWHPYFAFGDDPNVDKWILKIPARYIVELDDRLIPTGKLVPVEAKGLDFRQPRSISGTILDNVFTGLIPDNDGVVTWLADPDIGAEIQVWQDKAYGYLVVFTPPEPYRDSIAIEPMTCNTNAFNNQEGLIVLRPGESFLGRYGVRVSKM